MKLLARYALLGLVVLGGATACNDDDNTTNPTTGHGTVTATIDGTSFSGSSAVTASRSGNQLTIGAVETGGRQVMLVIPNSRQTFGSGTRSSGALSNNCGILFVSEGETNPRKLGRGQPQKTRATTSKLCL